jgi:hypothetical protein
MLDLPNRIKRFATTHRQGDQPNFFVIATPRSGSTWLAELLATQGRCKIVNEPLNLRKKVVRDNLKLSEWDGLFKPECRPLIRSYLQTFIDGTDNDLRYKRERPFTRFWHLRTDRIVFKMLFGGEDDIHWFWREFDGYVIHLLRHPIAVAQSRERLPRLHSFLRPPFSSNFSALQLDHAQGILHSSDTFQMRILDWCLQNAVPLRHATSTSLLVTYEQLVLQPEVVIHRLASQFNLPHEEAMLRHVYRASRSTGKSNARSQNVLRDENQIRRQREWLVDKWRERSSPAQLDRAFETLHIFGMDVYSRDRSLPEVRYMVRA